MAQPVSRWLPVNDVPAWGTTAVSRQRQAPDPEAVTLDDGGDAELISWVQELAKPLDWEAFCRHPDHPELTPEAMAAFLAATAAAAPGTGPWSAAQRTWLGRPHFALLLVFIHLLRHQRQLLNALPARHLDHYNHERLGFRPRPGEPDRVTVAFSLVADAAPIILPAGSLLRAGVDGEGEERLYRTLTELSLNHARVCRLRASQLERGVTSLTTIVAGNPQHRERLDRMLRLVYGEAAPAVEAIQSLGPFLQFWSIDANLKHLPLELREFLQLMNLVRQRCDGGSDQEWDAINRWLGVEELLDSGELSDRRDFDRNFCASLLGSSGGELDWENDGLSEVNCLDDLYLQRDNENVKGYLWQLFTASTCRLLHSLRAEDAKDQQKLFTARLNTFVQLMTMKLHIDAQWQQVNWLLERCGRRRRQLASWRLDPETPNSASAHFSANLAKALDLADAQAFAWPELPPESLPERLVEQPTMRPEAIPERCWLAFTDLEALQRRHALPLESLLRLSQLAQVAAPSTTTAAAAASQAKANPWPQIQEILSAAHGELWAARRREALARGRQGQQGVAAFQQTLWQALPPSVQEAQTQEPLPPGGGPPPWRDCLKQLEPWLPRGSSEALERFGALLEAPGTAPRRLSWPEVDGLLEGAQRGARGGEQPPELLQVNWRQLRGRELTIDAKAMAAGTPLAPCFGSSQDGGVDPPNPGPGVGFAVASRLLALAEGSRQIQLSLAFTAESGSLTNLLASLRPEPGKTLPSAAIAGEPPQGPDRPGWGLNQALLVEVSTAAGWWTLPIEAASLKDSPAKDSPAKAKPAQWELALTLALLPSDPPLAPLTPGELPRLRLRLRPWREGGTGGGQWRSCGGFEGLRVARARLRVEVGGEIKGKAQGLKGLGLQQDGTPVDPAEPFTPFGSQPLLGSSLFLSHPELLDGDLEEIRFCGSWQKLPDDLAAHYSDYTGLAATAVTAKSFQINLSLLEQNAPTLVEQTALPLFQPAGADFDRLKITCTFNPPGTSRPLASAPNGEALRQEDLRQQARVWRWRLTPTDFGHGRYPALAATKAQAMALAITERAGLQSLAMAEALRGTAGTLKERYDDALAALEATPIEPESYALPEPYTPLLAGLEVGYIRSQELGASGVEGGQLLRVHLFGEEEPLQLPPPLAPGSQAAWQAPLLLPSHPHPGELWLELEGIRPGQPIALAFQLAEGSARGLRPAEAIRWQRQQGWGWQPLPVQADGTDGLLHSGILRFALPEAAAENPPPLERIWIRASLLAPVEAYATILAIQSQAVEAEAVRPCDAEPLPPHSITDLEELVPEIAAIQQPFSSRAGRAAETEAQLRRRAAEQLRHKGRALAGGDYERLLWEAFASQLHTVVCLPAQQERGVEVLVIPNLLEQVPRNLFAPGASIDQLAAMERHLRQRCPAELAPVVRNAVYLPVTVRLWVCLRQGVDPAYAERQLRQELIRALSPWCFDAAAEVRLGGAVRASDLVAAVEALPFVAYLERLRLFLLDPGGKPLRSSDAILEAPAADVVLIAAASQEIEFVSAGVTLPSLIGIGNLRISLDFQVA
ncbi:MAG: baseplate J/gp47 family protein [Cyanobacteria bacterium]|nr:baseplate J/gp47 family protein [Cyanobacteriota bacterium]